MSDLTELRVVARYVRREQLLIEMPAGTIVGDHPVRLGGDGTGPSAGELVLLALSASAVLSAAEAMAGSGNSCGVSGDLVSRATFRSERERIEGPMVTMSYMSTLRHRLEIGAPGSPDTDDVNGRDDAPLFAPMAAARRCPVARSMQRGIRLAESVEFVQTDRSRTVNEFLNETIQADEAGWLDVPVGRHAISPAEAGWRVSVSYLEPGVALLHHPHQTLLTGRSAAGQIHAPAPNDLLAAALAACTVYYIAHNARFRGIPAEAISTEVVAQVDDTGAIASIEKVARVTGNLTAAERADIEFIAGHCYVGETMKRGTEVAFETEIVTGTLARDRAADVSEAECDDGACCVPDLAAAASVTTS
jgi:uncharacterized OsmC-like protein